MKAGAAARGREGPKALAAVVQSCGRRERARNIEIEGGERRERTHNGGNVAVKRFMALLVGIAFAASMTGIAAAQAPAEKKTDEKTMEKPATTKAKKPAAKSATGMVKSASADSVVVAHKVKGKEAEDTFAVDPNTKIKKAGKTATAADLAEGDHVTVRYTSEGGKMMASSITATAPKKSAVKKSEEKPAAEKK